mmetsp:Transcript_155248/g.298058  ORF Transcript_155248/g.298058 Transcript_155248/m.298058 type:complete len:658 (+) Transcript_155248:99-2072(+)
METFVDYAGRYQAAEEVAASIIDIVLTDGGARLFDRYLERKAFPYTAELSKEAVASRVKMCFVAHEDEEDPDDGWALEEEPQPGSIDAWARMQLEVRRPKMESTFVSTTSKESEQPPPPRRVGNRGPRNSGAPVRKTTAVKVNDASDPSKEAPRSFAIKFETTVDEEEEKFRAEKAEEDRKKMELEIKARDEEKKNREERQRIEAMHEEMERRKHTFDLNGNIIWVDDIKPEKLPRMQEVVPYGLKKDRFARTAPSDMETSTGFQTGKKKAGTSRQRRTRAQTSQSDKDHEYPDSFSKLQHAQPPILETMNMVPGVRLEFEGKEKNGPDTMKPAGHMSRQDYINLTELQGDVNLGDLPSIDENSPSGEAGGAAKTAPSAEEQVINLDAGAEKPADGDAPAPSGTGDKQPPKEQKQRSPAAKGGKPAGKAPDAAHGAEDEVTTQQKAPVAPPMQNRMNKFDALGFVARAPRFHAPALGGPTNARSVQPPLGATMGHGILRGKQNKDDYYFPDDVDQPDFGMRRSRSESSLLQSAGRAVLSRTPSQAGSMSPTSAAGMSPSHRSDRSVMGDSSALDGGFRKGRIVADRNAPAYRNARTALFPDSSLPGDSRRGGSRQGGSRQGGSRQGGSRQGGSQAGSQGGSRQGGSRQGGSRQGRGF